jgi:limonene-1,2-epoxide hydrolase
MAKSPEQVVLEFCAAFERKDLEFILGSLTDDCVYANVPIPPIQGNVEICKFLSHSLNRADKIEFVMVNIATSGDGQSVLTERVDVFHYGPNKVSVPLMGIFVVHDEKIEQWRDYADIASFVKAMAEIGQRPGISAS